MKRILYITYVDYQKNVFPGVQTKIHGQMEAMRHSGYKVDRISQYGKKAQYVCDEGYTKILGGVSRRFALLNAVKYSLVQNEYIAAYIRFQFFSEDVRQMLCCLNKTDTKVLMEIPTYPYEGELHQQGLKGEIKLLCDKMFRSPCAKYIDRFVVMCKEKKINGVPCINMKNGFEFATHPVRKITEPIYNNIHMLAVASMLPWHGYDRLLNGLAEYYRDNPNEMKVNFVLHLVGKGTETQKYENIIANNNLSDHAILYGMKSGNDLQAIVEKCSLAVGSLAAPRADIHFLSTLKSREYCAWGLPSINATKTDILSIDDPYVLYVPEDDSAIDIQRIIDFYHHVYFETGKTAEEIADEIREGAKKQCDIHVAFRPVLNFIEEIK